MNSSTTSLAIIPSTSTYLDIRGLRYHCREWRTEAAVSSNPTRRMFLLHGWMDVSASFQFLVDALREGWHVIAPDWRGYGETAWSSADSYWFADYYADLDRILEHYSPTDPVNLVGHSMGGNVSCLYAGIRPDRIRRLVNLEGFGMAPTQPGEAPKRYARWFKELAAGAHFRDYASFDELATRLQNQNPRLTAERARFLAPHWGVSRDDGRVALRGDPAHKIVNPALYQLDESKACWRAVTAPVLWVEGGDTATKRMIKLTEADIAERRACFANLSATVIPEAAHMLHHDQPARLATVVEEFLVR